jgi:hypothetical protein
MRSIKTYSKGAPFYNAFLREHHLALPIRAIGNEYIEVLYCGSQGLKNERVSMGGLE